MRKYSTIIIAVLLVISLFGGAMALSVNDLRCEYNTDPVGIDVVSPALSWKIYSRNQEPGVRSQENGANCLRQSAYQVVVSSSLSKLDRGVGDLWDSGKVSSDQSQHILYKGKTLTSKKVCFWKVCVWAQDDKSGVWSKPARWVMGLLEAGDWKAKWIKAPPPKVDDLKIISVTYGDAEGKESIDVKAQLEALLEQNKPIAVNPKSFGQSKDAKNYELKVEYELKGEKQSLTAKAKQNVAFDEQSRKGKAAPHFRKAFKLHEIPDSALLTVNAAAFFELYVNGEKIGQDVLTPAQSATKARTFSVAYDVRPYLKPGENCIGLWVGHWQGPFGNQVKIRAQLDAIVDGKIFTLGSDKSWQTRNSGRYTTRNGHFGGELVDARELIPDWSRPGVSSEGWLASEETTGFSGVVLNQPCPLNRLGNPIPPVSITPIDDGYEIDFGTNLTGWFRMRMPPLEAGQKVGMTFADSKGNRRDKGQGYQTFGQVSDFISAGKPGEVFQHQFNYAAFRYVIVKGLPQAPNPSEVSAMLIESDLEMVGGFECSNDLLNRIFELNEWTLRCLNLGGYSVDCPHRERKGYGGDGQTPVEGFLTSFRADGFYRKWLMDWKDVQRGDGSLPNTAPQGNGGGGPAWGGFVAAVTWRHYLYYGDRRVLEENIDTVRKYVECMEKISQQNGDLLTGKTGRFSFIGDWVAPGRGMDSKNMPSHEAREIFNNCYRIYHLQLYMKIAEALGKRDEVAKYEKVIDKIQPIIHKTFYNADTGTYVYDQQAYYILPLMTGIVPENKRAKVFKDLEKNILVTREGHLDTGLLGTYFMMEYLREIGRNDLVFTMFNQTTYPGWGYMLEQGATTVWEQWNGFWSHIHSCFPSANNWLYQGLAGIQADPDAPGFRNVIIKPEIVGDVNWVRSHYVSNYGRVVSNWKLEDGGLVMEVTIPPNSTGTVYVPAGDASGVLVNGRAVKEAGHVDLVKVEPGRTVLTLDSGCYEITATR